MTIGLLRWFTLGALLVGLGLAPAAVAAKSRGVTLKLRASEASGAPVEAEVELYSKSYALVIGIDDYSGGWPRLGQAVNDARKVAKALEAQGFDVSLKTNLKARGLERAFKDFFILRGSDADARLFVWFAGHGHTDQRGEGYLIPSDGVLERNRVRFLRTALSLRRFGEFVRLAESKHVFTVFDSCFAGTIFNVARAAPPPQITRITTEPVRQFLTSGDAGQTVSDDGAFARLFVEALQGERRADGNGDGYLTASEMGSFLDAKMSNYTKNRQTPRYGKLSSLEFDKGDFVFALGKASASVKKRKPAVSTGGGSAETVFWQSIEDSQSRMDFEDFLRKFPNGTFASLAERRLATLESAQKSRRETEAKVKEDLRQKQEQDKLRRQDEARRSLFDTLLADGEDAIRRYQKTAAIDKFSRALNLYPDSKKARERLNRAKNLIDPCKKIIGEWAYDWTFGISDVTVSGNGSAYSRYWMGDVSGHWECADRKSRKFVFRWSHGFVGTVYMLPNGNEFNGKNNRGWRLHGIRKGSPEAAAKQKAAEVGQESEDESGQ